MQKLTREKFIELCGTRGITSVHFIKRDNSYRKMGARLGVTKGVTGAGKAYKDEDHDIVTVFDMGKKSFRSIRMESVVKIQRGKKVLFKRKIFKRL